MTLATWNVDLTRRGPGLLLRDLLKGKLGLVVGEIAQADPDVLLLTDIDHDHDGVALAQLARMLAEAGAVYPYRLTARPNSGMPTGLDLDGDGRLGGAGDAQGYGEFSGQGGMAVLSRLPVTLERDFSALLWADLPGNLRIAEDPAPDLQRLSSSAHWQLRLGSEPPLSLLAWHATPPVFDGPDDRNGRRGADELALWLRLLDGALGAPPQIPVLIGDANIDPARGEGRHDAIRAALDDPRLQDPLPGTDTVIWEQTGPMRVSYILPSATLTVLGAQTRPPIADDPHRMVLVTLDLP
ncbi:endonuclease/exonuclease/phosphatase family protein [Salipiger sp. 1_MG-2023]|uniref:endonuclease/exonuclease/phosphatase family protein n=1 Tax=Salipiger sp. 1_MG-2023 TaxID=3062665 RepID=UPI0026E40BA5|nr:endonuclease/exonuclease/phosphatase family protein [Salipiger sp. 1_MG-2023]MDO6584097.1 endonuclease/exonuclease/phosphatase family protein [Salipiger sp. 1_MG-2023]